MPLLRVQSFANTLDIEEDTDRLRDPAHAHAWLTSAGLIDEDAELGESDLREARACRGALRTLLAHNASGPAPTDQELAPLRDLAQRSRPSVTIGPTGTVELSCQGDLVDGLVGLLLIVGDAQSDGTWSRLKLCANPDCGWAFYDRSRNQQGSWCSMAVCGNRLKNRRFRARG